MMSILPAACLSFLTLGSLSVFGVPENYLPAISLVAVFITLTLIMVLVRAGP
jgi:hypothetical protein